MAVSYFEPWKSSNKTQMIKVTTAKVGHQDNHIWKNTITYEKWYKCANGDTMTIKITIKLCGAMVLLSY